MMRFTNLLTVMMLSVLFVIGLMQLTEIKNISALVVSLSPSRQAQDSKTEVPTMNVVSTGKGNGAPKGQHFNLNIIGSKYAKMPESAIQAAEMELNAQNGGHVIFVPLVGTARIMLSEGKYTDPTNMRTAFAVTDKNGTDGKAAFTLPNPDPDGDGVTIYSVYARAKGTPGGKSTTTSCVIDPVDGAELCSVRNYISVRSKGGSKFEDVSEQLLFVYLDLLDLQDLDGDGVIHEADGTPERYSIFDTADRDGDSLPDLADYQYEWMYQNEGLKLLQLRFYYNVPTTVSL